MSKKMDDNSINRSLLSWASEDHRTPAKRQKLDTSNSSSLNNPSNCECLLDPAGNCRRLKTELGTIRARLSQSEITSVCLNNVRKEIEEIHEREKIVLQMQVKSDAEVKNQLLEDLEAAKMSAHGAHEAQVATKSKMSELQTKMEEQVSEMSVEFARLTEMIHSTSEDTSASPKSQKDDLESLKTKLEAAETEIIQLKEENLISQTHLEHQRVELEQANITIRMFDSEKSLWKEREKVWISRAKELEKQLESLKNVISTLGEAVKEKDLMEEQISSMREETKDGERLRKAGISRSQQTDPIVMDEEGLKPRVDDLEKKLEELERKTGGFSGLLVD